MPLNETSSDPRVPAVTAQHTNGGEAVFGETNGSMPVAAVHGASTDGRGVVGESVSAEGVLGVSSTGQGVLGISTGTGQGVRGTGVTGVFGESSHPTGVGTSGVNNAGPGAVGVLGSSASGIGVRGMTINGLAGQFDGDVQVNGNLSKSGSQFVIDHPLDPANKYLRHSIVESPDMLNIYSGIALLDASGEATVELPGWLEALNEDFRYGLTPIGGPGPNLYVAEEVDGNRFKIAGGLPGMKVSWQITGIRRDPYAVQHRVRVEEDKPEQERGKYLHPKEYGLPESMGIYYDPGFQADEWRNEHNYVQRK